MIISIIHRTTIACTCAYVGKINVVVVVVVVVVGVVGVVALTITLSF
jgi:hypothetical protein